MTVTIRPARSSDAGGFGAAVKAVAEERRWLQSTHGFALGQTQSFLDRLLAQGLPPQLALDGERVVGWCDINRCDGLMAHGGVLGMGLLPAYRGQGIGARLIAAALETARAAGLIRVELTVFAGNSRARRLYERAGFRQEGRLRRGVRYDDGSEDDLLVMALLLDE